MKRSLAVAGDIPVYLEKKSEKPRDKCLELISEFNKIVYTRSIYRNQLRVYNFQQLENEICAHTHTYCSYNLVSLIKE